MSFSELTENLRDFDINNLEWANAGSWPLLIKIIAWVIVLSTVVFLGHYLHLNAVVAPVIG